MNAIRFLILLLLSISFIFLIAGCGGDTDTDEGETLIDLELKNLGQLTSDFQYVVWVESNDRIDLLERFNTEADNTATFSSFSLIGTLVTGDRIFVTIEPNPDPEPDIPGDTRVLDGTITGNTAVLTFPRMQSFVNAAGFITVTENHSQLLADFDNLPDISDLNFIYQGFLQRGNTLTPLSKFRFDQVPVSDSVNFDVTSANYILTIEPVPDFNPNRPYTIQPFFSNGPLLELFRQPLAKSSLTPDDLNFRFPSGIATVR